MKHVYMVEAELESELAIYTKALKTHCAAWDFQQQLRTYWKYTDLSDMTAEQLIDKLWDEWHETMAGALEE
jgi:D-hexose-6-phosphate mutarotase